MTDLSARSGSCSGGGGATVPSTIDAHRRRLGDICSRERQRGDWVRISVWIKASGLLPDSAALYPGTWAVGFTPLFFAQAMATTPGTIRVGPQTDYTFAFPRVTAFDWTQYYA